MATRTIKELLKIMLDHEQLFHDGLCCWCKNMRTVGLISRGELAYMKRYISDNRPTGFISRFRYWYTDGDGYYWGRGRIKPRIKWIKKHINKL